MERMKDGGEPMVLTVSGEAKLIVQDADCYQKLLESIDYNAAVKGIACGFRRCKAWSDTTCQQGVCRTA
jgi:hypothetical protein